MPALNSDHLLEQADELIGRPAGGGAARQVDLKRAISAAYYAIFHAVAAAAADDFVGKSQRHTPQYALAYRSIDHKSVRTLCEDIIKTTLPGKYSKYLPTGGFGPDLVALATAVVDLQEKRLSADYDPLFRVRTSDATLAIGTGRAALIRFRNATRARRKAFLSLLLFSPR